MGSRRIKIVIVLLVVAAIAAVVFLSPKRFHVDKTQYELSPVTDPNGSPLQVIAINSSGQMVAYPSVLPGGVWPIYRIDPDGCTQVLSIPKEYRATTIDINDCGAIVGTVSGQNNSQDAFVWDPQQGFQLVPVRVAFPNADSDSVKINNRGIIVGHWERQESHSKGVFFYDPNEGVFDIEPLGQIAVSIGGLTEDGVIVGGFQSPSGHHAFLWTRQEGLVDIHPGTTYRANSNAIAINESGWILIWSFDKEDEGEVVWYNRKIGNIPSRPWNYIPFIPSPIPSTDRFTVVGYRPSWKIGKFRIRPVIGKFRIRPDEWNNWILEMGQKPMLINPKILSEKLWLIVGMDDRNEMVGNSSRLRNAPLNGSYPPQGFILRPIRPGDSGKK